MKGALKFRHFVLGAIAIFVYVGIEVGVPGTLNLFLTDPVEKGGAGIASTISGFVVGTYWFLMLIGRLAGASLGAKVSSKAMLTFTSATGIDFSIPCYLLFYRNIGESACTSTKRNWRFVIRFCRSAHQRYVLGISWSLYFYHVGWYLQPCCRRTG